MLTASKKSKGRLLQQKVRDLLLMAFPHLGTDDIRSTSMGASGEDIQLSPLARVVIPHNVEVKKHKKFSIYTEYRQAKSHGRHEPLVVIEADRQRPLAIVDFEYYVGLLAAVHNGGSNGSGNVGPALYSQSRRRLPVGRAKRSFPSD